MEFMRLVLPRLTLPGALYATMACGAFGTNSRPGLERHARSAQPSASRHVLFADELKGVPGSNAYDVVRRLRPAFLRTRGPLHAPIVFLDHMRLGGVNELRQIPSATIQEVRYLDALAATQQFGTGYSGGVIHVLTGPR